MSLNNQNIEQLLKEHLAQHTGCPEPQLWQRIHDGKRPPEPSPWRSLPVEIIAGIIGVGFVVGMMLWFSHDQRQPSAENQITLATQAADAIPAISTPSESVESDVECCRTTQPRTVGSVAAPAHNHSQLQPAISPVAVPVVASAALSSSPSVPNTSSEPDEVGKPHVEQSVALAPKVGTSAPAPTPEPLQLFFPNVITPNGDGINDYFVVKGADDIDDLQLQIFNAQQRRVYTNSHYKGDFSGADLPAGTYFFVARIASRDYIHRGSLVIVK